MLGEAIARFLATPLGQSFKGPFQRAMSRTGYEVVQANGDSYQLRRSLIPLVEDGTVLDVGANQGQFARRMRHHGYVGPIVSFEPGRAAFARLRAAAKGDPNWEVRQLALGNAAGTADLFVSQNSVSSSLLPMAERHIAAAPSSAFAHSETVAVRTLDSLTSVHQPPFWLKIDTQGYEMPVIEGASRTLERTAVVEIELSLVPLYAGQADYMEVLQHLTTRGFAARDIRPAFRDRSTGALLQVDLIAVNERVAS